MGAPFSLRSPCSTPQLMSYFHALEFALWRVVQCPRPTTVLCTCAHGRETFPMYVISACAEGAMMRACIREVGLTAV